MPPDEAPVDVQDKPDETEAPETGQAEESQESFTDFDPSEIPEDAGKEWFEEKYNELRAGFTQKTQGLAEERREAEQAQAIVEGLSNPELAPHYLKLLGHDPNDPNFLGMLGYELADSDEDLDDDFLETGDPRVDQIINHLQTQEAQRAEEQQTAEVEEYIAEQIEGLEGEETFDTDEIAFLRNYAESHQTARGLPDVEGGANLLKGIVSKRQQQWIDSKKTTRPPGPGADAKRQVDLANIDDPAERRRAHNQLVVEAAEQAQASQE
jgi:hypothetical protein